jgi:thiamine biosynthesis protein ThiS
MQTEKIRIQLNGRPTDVDHPVSLGELLKRYQIKAETVVLELNRRIVEKKNLGEITLREGDALEIVHFVGGG